MRTGDLGGTAGTDDFTEGAGEPDQERLRDATLAQIQQTAHSPVHVMPAHPQPLARGAPDLTTLLARHGNAPQALVQILREVQAQQGWLPRNVLSQIAAALGQTLAHVESVAGFYRFFHTEPVGAYRVLFSDNVTDRLLGSRALMTDLCRRWGWHPGDRALDGLVSVDGTSCTGLCDQGPALLINHHQVVTRLDATRVAQMAGLIRTRVPLPINGRRIGSRCRTTSGAPTCCSVNSHAPGVALAGRTGAWRDTPMLAEMKRSNLRGRGGAGFGTGLKWDLCRRGSRCRARGGCNADEGEPGTFEDRVLLAARPTRMFDGMTIAAHVIGARIGLVYLRGEYRYLLESLQAVLQRRRDARSAGRAILGHEGFDFDIDIHVGAGAYVCGEESALIESLEGKRGRRASARRSRWSSGYLGQPTMVNNVETFCAAGQIAVQGGAWWAGIGTAKSTGTKIHSVSGDCERPGLYEYPYGTRIGTILEDCGAQDTQAVQVGGPSGGRAVGFRVRPAHRLRGRPHGGRLHGV